jgi:hypothetical protein
VSVKRVSIHSGPGGPLVPLATFRLEGERLSADWHNERYRREIESSGQRAMVDGALRTLRPSDGGVFFEHLEALYFNSSLMVVETVEP